MREIIKAIAQKFNITPFQTRQMRRTSSVGFPCTSLEQQTQVLEELKDHGYPYVTAGKDAQSPIVFASSQPGPNSDIEGFVLD